MVGKNKRKFRLGVGFVDSFKDGELENCFGKIFSSEKFKNSPRCQREYVECE